jgi:CBS domain containing-hemolysin-like protein
MVTFAAAVLCLLLALATIAVGKAYEALPLAELKRRAAAGNKQAQQLYRTAAYGSELTALAVCVATLSAAAGFVLFARVAPPIFGFIVVVLALLLAYTWLPRKRQGVMSTQAAVGLAPAISGLLRFLHPILGPLATLLHRHKKDSHTGLFDREDVYELVERQKRQADSRLTEAELERMRRVLQLGENRVRDVLVPVRRVKMVAAGEALSPVLLDELYGSGHAFFPVYEGDTSDVVGLLSLDRVADIKRQGKASDYSSAKLAYVHEADTLEQALRALAESRQHMLVVINNTGEYIGIVTLSDITHWLLGAAEQRGAHDDRDAVAARHARAVSTSSEKVVQ